jgi:DnaJ family protein A protein 2
VFHGEADEYPGTEPGDVIITIKEMPHKLFKRKGADLLIEKEITLLEALTGVDFVVTHLDGTKLRI